ncbi:MAG: hypothetical protein Q6K08_01700, partial [Thermostichales cyanobacterium GMQP_bins_62]
PEPKNINNFIGFFANFRQFFTDIQKDFSLSPARASQDWWCLRIAFLMGPKEPRASHPCPSPALRAGIEKTYLSSLAVA